MSRWNEQFRSHAFRTTLGALKAALEDDELEKAGNEEAAKEIARLNKVVAYLDSTLAQSDPELVPLAHLATLNQHLSSCVQELTAFKGNQSIGHLHNANAQSDAVIVLLSQTPFAGIGPGAEGLSKAAAAYADALDRHLAKLGRAVSTEMSEVKKNAEELKSGIAETDKGLVSLKEQLQTVTQTIQKQTAEFNTQFQANEKARTDKGEAATVKLQERMDGEFKDLATKAGLVLKILGKFHDDAAKVYGVVVNTAQAGAYSIYAKEEKRAADYLRWSAISLMVIGVVILVAPEILKIFSDAEDYVLDWKRTLGRVPFSLILFVPAFYLAGESKRHRNTEITNRRRELILSTIDPYLALLDNGKAEQIKVDVAKGIFSEGGLTAEESGGDPGNVLAQLTNFLKQAKR